MKDVKFDQVLARIAARANDYDQSGEWPAEDLNDLFDIGAMGWAVSKEFGGADLDAVELNERYQRLACASLATALIVSQRDSALGYLEESSNINLRADLLPKLLRNQSWCTIGISHLTTSNQSGTLIAKKTDDGFLLHGTIPWATGGSRSEFIVAGAMTEDGKQLVFVLPTREEGVTVRPPLRLATLSAAHTSAIDCVDVKIGRNLVVAGPADAALAKRRKSLPVAQVFAALGLTRAALDLIKKINHPSATATFDSLEMQFQELTHTARITNSVGADAHDLQRGPLLRSECNNLALRATHAAVTLYKGSALRVDHPAQRLARESLFLLVWSSPGSVTDRNLELFSESH